MAEIDHELVIDKMLDNVAYQEHPVNYWQLFTSRRSMDVISARLLACKSEIELELHDMSGQMENCRVIRFTYMHDPER